MKKTKLNMMTTFLLVGFIPLISTAIISIIISIIDIGDVLSTAEKEKLKVATENLTTYFQEDISDDGSLDLSKYTDYSYIDSFIKDDIQLTLFRGDTRIMTSLKNEDGTRNEVSDGTLWEGQIALYFRWTCLPDCAVPELDADYRRNNRRLS